MKTSSSPISARPAAPRTWPCAHTHRQALGDVEDDYKPDDDDLSDDEEMQRNMAQFQFGGFAKHDEAELDPATESNGPRFGTFPAHADNSASNLQNAPRDYARGHCQGQAAQVRAARDEAGSHTAQLAAVHSRQATDTLTHELDDEFRSIHGLLVQESDRFEREASMLCCSCCVIQSGRAKCRSSSPTTTTCR